MIGTWFSEVKLDRLSLLFACMQVFACHVIILIDVVSTQELFNLETPLQTAHKLNSISCIHNQYQGSASGVGAIRDELKLP